ncbi:hypothetical protein HK096_006745, partial [Nowakowskiella sp. JEL0078]
MTEKEWPSSELVNVVKEIVEKKGVDIRFLGPVLGAMEKVDVLAYLKRIVQLLDGTERQRRVVYEIFLKIIDVSEMAKEDKDSEKKALPSERKAPLTPVELLVVLHTLEDAVGLKRQMEATDICIKSIDNYDPESFAVVLQQLTDTPKQATLLMRTTIQCVSRFPSLSGFINNIILPRMVSKKVWTNAKLWPGWIKCAEVTAPGSVSVILGLPKEQIVDVLRKSVELKGRIGEWADSMDGSQQVAKIRAILAG